MEGYRYQSSEKQGMAPEIAIPKEVNENPASQVYPDEGLIPRSIRELFAVVDAKRSHNKAIQVYV